MIFSENRCTLFRIMRYRANWASTSLQAGDNAPACEARHWAIRPPPGRTPPQSVRMSAPQAERATNTSSRSSSGRSTITVAAGAAAAAGAPPQVPAPAAAVAPPARAAPPPAAATALAQAADTLALFFSRHSSAASPPVGTPAQTLG